MHNFSYTLDLNIAWTLILLDGEIEAETNADVDALPFSDAWAFALIFEGSNFCIVVSVSLSAHWFSVLPSDAPAKKT